uniref:Uncharacterized protein n=1 Tax=Oryza rufipogon TaxID=4529 RepID=A0A0E0P5Y2_ORYRU
MCNEHVMFKVFHSCYSLFVSQHKEMLLQILHDAQRYSAFRKGLAMIDICQLKNDPEEVLKWLKFSTGWSVLHNSELRIGLKRHMDLLKEHEGNKMNPLSMPEDENLVLEKINAELCSELEKMIGTFDWALMSQYYYKARFSNFARQCAIQARASGVILVKQALPIRETWKEQKQSTSPKVSKLSLEDCLGSLRRPLRRINEQFGRGAAREFSRDCISEIVTFVRLNVHDLLHIVGIAFYLEGNSWRNGSDGQLELVTKLGSWLIIGFQGRMTNKIRILADNWIPGKNDEQSACDSDTVRSFFEEDIANAILQIPISSHGWG